METREQKYEATMEIAAKKIEQLNAPLEEIGFEQNRKCHSKYSGLFGFNKE